jgi:tRNA-dihydrouridine synthase
MSTQPPLNPKFVQDPKSVLVDNFWLTLEKPIIGLAPMDGVTDAAFRHIVAKYGHPSVIFTEFTSVEGLRAGAQQLLTDFLYSEEQRPIVAQLFGSDPAAFYLGGYLASALGFDGIDLNMGCPAKNITQRGSGAALIQDLPRAKQIIKQIKNGSQAWFAGVKPSQAGVPAKFIDQLDFSQFRSIPRNDQSHLPISVKTRLGYSQKNILDWLPDLLEENLAAVTVHARTYKQLYSGEPDWKDFQALAELTHSYHTLLLGNGNVTSRMEAVEMVKQYQLDGILIGRASFGNPWVFTDQIVSPELRLRVSLEQAEYLAQVNPKGFLRIRKHLYDYCKGWEGAKSARLELMHATNISDVRQIIDPLLQGLAEDASSQNS